VTRPNVAIAAGALALLGACPTADEGPRPMTAVHAAAIRDSVQTTIDAFLRHAAAAQWDSLAALYDDSPDFRWLEQGLVRYRSVAQIREELRRRGPDTRIETSFLDTKIVVLGPGAASVATAFHTRFVDPRNPGGLEFGGVMTMVLAHREAGWKFVSGHTSSPAR
jgi:hypothetical protein